MEKIAKEEVEKLMDIKGQTRGVVLRTDMEFVLEEKGEEGLKKIEDKLREMGCPIKYREVKSMEFYPVGLRALSLLVIREALDFNDEKIKKMGLVATKTSLIIKLFVRYFLSVERVFFKEAPKIWQKHWTIGELVPVELDEKEKHAVLRLKNFDLHPLYCSVYLRGYFSGILQMLIKSPKIDCEEIKCSLKGSEYHEYLLKWQ